MAQLEHPPGCSVVQGLDGQQREVRGSGLLWILHSAHCSLSCPFSLSKQDTSTGEVSILG